MRRYVLAVLIGIDILINAILGGTAYTTISMRLGASIRSDGWASRIKWPKRLHKHFLDGL